MIEVVSNMEYEINLNEIVYNGSKFQLIPKHIYYVAKFDVPNSELEMWKNFISEILNLKSLAGNEQIITIPNTWIEELGTYVEDIETYIYRPSNDGKSHTITFIGSFHSCWKLFKEFQEFNNHYFYINTILEGLKLRKESTEDLVDKELTELIEYSLESSVESSQDWEESYLIFLENTNQQLDFELKTYKEIEEDEEEARMSYLYDSIDEFIRSDDFNGFGYTQVSYEEYMQDYD
jgi:hypothetical protein